MKAYLNKLSKQEYLTNDDVYELSERLIVANRNGVIKARHVAGSINSMGTAYIFSVGMILEIKRVGKPKVTKLVTKKKK